MDRQQPTNVINPKPIKLSDVFNNVEPPQILGGDSPNIGNGYRVPQPKGEGVLTRVSQFEVGQGNNTIKMDQQGLWLGNQKFEKARYRMGMDGTVVYNDGENDRILMGEDPTAT